MNQKFDILFKRLTESPDQIIFRDGQRGYFDDSAFKPTPFTIIHDSLLYCYRSVTHKTIEIVLDNALDAIGYYKSHNKNPARFVDDLMFELDRSDVAVINYTPKLFDAYVKSLKGRFWRYGYGYISFWSVKQEVMAKLPLIEKLIETFNYSPNQVLWEVPVVAVDRSKETLPKFEQFSYSDFIALPNYDSPEIRQFIQNQEKLHTIPGLKRALGIMPPPKISSGIPAEREFISKRYRGD